jgi:hypothetical protein
VLYEFVPLETGIARDSLFLGLSQRCKESGFRSRKFGLFQCRAGPAWHSRVSCRPVLSYIKLYNAYNACYQEGITYRFAN